MIWVKCVTKMRCFAVDSYSVCLFRGRGVEGIEQECGGDCVRGSRGN